MIETTTVHLKTGWDDEYLQNKINREINDWENKGWRYKDIKVSSSSPDTLLIFDRITPKVS